VQLLVAEVSVDLATDTTVHSIQREEARKVNKLTFTTHASESSRHPGLPGHPLFPRREGVRVVAMQQNVRVHLFKRERSNYLRAWVFLGIPEISTLMEF